MLDYAGGIVISRHRTAKDMPAQVNHKNAYGVEICKTRQVSNTAFHESAKLNPCFLFSGPDRVSERSKKVWRRMGEDVSQ